MLSNLLRSFRSCSLYATGRRRIFNSPCLLLCSARAPNASPPEGYCVVSSHALTAGRHLRFRQTHKSLPFQSFMRWLAACTASSRRNCGSEAGLQLFAITRAGLLAITVAVCALWACIAVEKVTVARTNLEVSRTFLQLQKLRRPASIPIESPVT